VSTVVDELRGVRLFSGLSQRQLKRLAGLVKERHFRQGVVVVEENTRSAVGLVIVAEGEASVSVDGTEVARIGPGDHFGEFALITEDPRTATVTAVTSLRCYVIAFWDFRKLVKENPDVAWKLLQHLAGLLTGERKRHARASLLSS
jgi:CRP-like cAMP-binding protein